MAKRIANRRVKAMIEAVALRGRRFFWALEESEVYLATKLEHAVEHACAGWLELEEDERQGAELSPWRRVADELEEGGRIVLRPLISCRPRWVMAPDEVAQICSGYQ
ncbi:hypothetical protein [Aeromonas salmonicida]|uniref:hypothetical protein n=1 Tax=Aeromonas salmonicida TaxID=645 RepID=UPI0030D1FAC2